MVTATMIKAIKMRKRQRTIKKKKEMRASLPKIQRRH
jgi:hypothetical protein